MDTSVWDFMLSVITGVTEFYYFLVPVLVMATFATAIRLANNHYY